MTVLITAFLEHIAPYALTIGAALIGALGLWVHGRISGAKREKEKQAAAEIAARDIKDQVQNDVGALPADAARKELGKWSKG